MEEGWKRITPWKVHSSFFLFSSLSFQPLGSYLLCMHAALEGIYSQIVREKQRLSTRVLGNVKVMQVYSKPRVAGGAASPSFCLVHLGKPNWVRTNIGRSLNPSHMILFEKTLLC